MAEIRYCKYCDVPFTAKRDDHYFCCAAHVAAYYRAHPNPDYIHAEKQHIHEHFCEFCGVPYKVNDYAQRGGAREPKYCSPKCKQAAYRQRQKGSQEQAKRRYSGNTGGSSGSTGNSGSGQGSKQQNAGNGQKSGNQGQSSGASDFWKGYNSKLQAAYKILGLPDVCTQKQIKAAWLALVKVWHPDINKSPEATIMTQKLNWAYDYLKTS